MVQNHLYNLFIWQVVIPRRYLDLLLPFKLLLDASSLSCCIIAMAFWGFPVVLLLLVVASAQSAQTSIHHHETCPSVVFAFGDSLTDTGNLVRTWNPALLSPAYLPYGMTYFRNGAQRFSDGRLIIDCIAQSLGLPFLPPFMDFVGTDFSHGVNYAVASAVALNYTYSVELGTMPFTTYTLDVQLQWHQTFLQFVEAGLQGGVTTFPNASSTSEATYFIEIGGNDFGNFAISGFTHAQTMNLLPLVVEKVGDTIQFLYDAGARNFMLSGLGLMGCSPNVKYFVGRDQTLDARGCVAWVNEVCRNYSDSISRLGESLQHLLPNTSFIFLDLYAAVDEIMTSPSDYGIVDIQNVCCGAPSLGAASVNGFNPEAMCSHLSVLCNDPNTFLIWDGIHYTDNVYRQIVNMFIEGKFISPSNALSRCDAISLNRA